MKEHQEMYFENAKESYGLLLKTWDWGLEDMSSITNYGTE